MEWKTAEKAKPGQMRERLKFAWWPEQCADGQTRWLCDVRVVEEMVAIFDGLNREEIWVRRRTYRAEFEESRP